MRLRGQQTPEADVNPGGHTAVDVVVDEVRGVKAGDVAGVVAVVVIDAGGITDGGVNVMATGGGLKPPGMSSVEPMGTPSRPTAARPPMPVGDDAEAEGFKPLAVPEEHTVPPDITEALPLASKSAPGLDRPVVKLAELSHTELPLVIVPGVMLPGSTGLMPGDVI